VSSWLSWPWFLLGVGVSEFHSVVKVSGVVESRSRGIGLSECQVFVVSEYCGVKVSGCAVKILARSLVSQHFC
jgi:hypothetical protein